jgi:hypothetical protein
MATSAMAPDLGATTHYGSLAGAQSDRYALAVAGSFVLDERDTLVSGVR